MKSAAASVILILSGFLSRLGGATVYESDGSAQDVQRLHDIASDGDTITLPVGTFSWTSRLNITKGITLRGETTIVAPSSNPTVTDATIIRDNTPRSGSGVGIIKVAIRSSQSFRLTGFTFVPGSSTTIAAGNGAIHLVSQDSAPNTSMRVDHCHFASLYQSKNIWVYGWVYGVADHNVIECTPSGFSFLIWHDTFGGISQINGNGSWADYPWYGTGKFFFIEDNTIIGSRVVTSGVVDAINGGRYVARHNYFKDAQLGGHGTEGGIQRGMRAHEVYDNVFNWTYAHGGGMQRSGTSLWHDNSWVGNENGDDKHTHLVNYRETSARARPVWGLADGTSPWDANDTEGNGTYVEGHAPFLFQSGKDTSSINSQGVVHDSAKSWATNRWAGYSVTNTNPLSPAYLLGSYIISNTSNTLTYYFYSGTDTEQPMVFNAGDTYQIHRVLTQLDQNGRGKGDHVVGSPSSINSTTGTPWWTHDALEPCFSWNNVYTPNGHALGYESQYPTVVSNRDYYNLGVGFAMDTTPPAVASTYTARLNGVDYVGPFVYPHPLVSSASVPTDVNGDGKPDYLLYSPTTQQTAIWYLNNDVLIGHAFGPTLWSGWSLVGVADFNGDGKPDYLLYNPTTRQTAIWYLNDDVLIGHAFGPTPWFGWSLVAP